MCGRFVASRRIEEIVEILDVDDVEVPPELIEPRWNIAPQADILAVTSRVPHRPAADGEGSGRAGADEAAPARRRLALFHWGLVPSWAKDPSVGNRMFNARAESLRSKPAFRSALVRRRCLIPADAFYEWEKIGGGAGRRPSRRRPWIFEAPDGDLLTFAGLWEAWRPRRPDPSTGELPGWLLSCTIITTDANEAVAPVHDRMPVLILPDDRDAWLAPDQLGEDELHALLAPAPAGALAGTPVSTEVNDARAEGPGLARHLAADEEAGGEVRDGASGDDPSVSQGSLFDRTAGPEGRETAGQA